MLGTCIPTYQKWQIDLTLPMELISYRQNEIFGTFEERVKKDVIWEEL